MVTRHGGKRHVAFRIGYEMLVHHQRFRWKTKKKLQYVISSYPQPPKITYRSSGRCVSEGLGRQLAREGSPFHASQVLLLGKAPRQEKVRNRRCLDRAIQLPSRCRLVHRKGGLHDGRFQQLCPRAILVKLPRIAQGKRV